MKTYYKDFIPRHTHAFDMLREIEKHTVDIVQPESVV